MEELSIFEAAHVLGGTPQQARDLLRARGLVGPRGGRRERLTVESVEALAVECYRWRSHVDDPGSYWVTNARAREILGVNKARVNQLADKGFLPFVTNHDGTRLYRRFQLETVANARSARKLRQPMG